MNERQQDQARDLVGTAAGWGCLAGVVTLVVVSFLYTITEVPFP